MALVEVHRKGISPLIASVLLIAFTMTIAGLMAAWATSYVSGQTEKLTEQSETTKSCSGANFRIESDTMKTNTSVTVVLYNSGGVDFTNMNVNMFYTNSTDVIIQKISNVSGALKRGDLKSFKVDNNQTAAGAPLTKMTIIADNCPDVAKEKSF